MKWQVGQKLQHMLDDRLILLPFCLGLSKALILRVLRFLGQQQSHHREWVRTQNQG